MSKRQRSRIQPENRRLALLAQELGLAMIQVLMDHYMFDQSEASKALDMVLAKAKENRNLYGLYQGAATSAYLSDAKPDEAISISGRIKTDVRKTRLK